MSVKLYDEILSKGVDMKYGQEQYAGFILRSLERMRYATCVDISTAARYFSTFVGHSTFLGHKGVNKLSEDFPLVRPPLSPGFYEWKATEGEGYFSCGFFVECPSWEEDEDNPLSMSGRESAAKVFNYDSEDMHLIENAGRVLVEATFFLKFSRNRSPKSVFTTWVLLDEDGNIAKNGEGEPFNSTLILRDDWDDVEEEADIEIFFFSMFATVLYFGLSMMNCKGSYLEERKPEAKLRKKAKKKRGVEIFDYRVLRVEALEEAVRYAKTKTEDPDSRALHLTRGHFRNYTKENPLFGHYVGNVWINQHLRGRRKNGVVHKDYETGRISKSSVVNRKGA